MELKQIMSQEVAAVLEEATGIVTNRLVMESLLKNGKVTIEEATFLNKLASEVITEAAEDFIPDSIEVPDPVQETVEESVQVKPTQEQAPTIEESAQDVKADEAKTEEVVEESTQDVKADEAKTEEVVEESTQDVKADEAKTEEAVEESTQDVKADEAAPAQEELTESEAIVNNLINKLF